ncbi:MAG: hypothetical protein M1365_05770, partial [Actinobacteria bacterium]|nr:hypothetical protein [Actinomycetota bacterium]
VEYEIKLKNAKAGDVVIFAENYDKYWEMSNGDTKINSNRHGSLNSFKLSGAGDYSVNVYYAMQKWVIIGVYIGLGALFTSLSLLIFLIFRNIKS